MTVGWYVHHHGAGHLHRLGATLPHLSGSAVALSSHPGVAALGCEHVALPLDLTDAPVDPTAHDTLHWAPVGNAGLRERMAAISGWIAAARPAAMVVDVSVEVALLARLHGVPVVLVAQRGRRSDAAHALAYAQAAAVAAPWTAASQLDHPVLPAGATYFVGAISRFDGTGAPSPLAAGGDVLCVLGAGGHSVTSDAIAAAAATTPDRTWHVAGSVDVFGPNVAAHGSGADVAALLAACSVVVGSAGGNVVAEVAAARRAYVCLPQERPFDEQREQARALERLGVAEVREAWPAPAEWPRLLEQAEARDPGRWALLHDGGGAQRLAAVVDGVAA